MVRLCKGKCDMIGTSRPFGNPYDTRSYCRICSAWLEKEVGIRCPCCGNILKVRISRKPRLSKLL